MSARELVYEDNASAIGHTPLVRLNRVVPPHSTAKVWAKVEGRNPAYSVKCRIGAPLIEDAEKRGVLRRGVTIVEPTSGNTGIALACVGASKGYKVVLTMPESFSVERRKILKAFGATVVLTDKAKGMPGAIAKAHEMQEEDPEHVWIPNQFENPANPAAHEATTGPEIWDALDGRVDVVVIGTGTGGTLTGVARYIKKTKGRESCISVAVEPEESPVLTQTRAGQPITPGPHGIQGIGPGFVPKTLDMSLVDRIETVTTEEAIRMARRLASEEGLLSGVSSGAAALVAVRLAALQEYAGKNIVVVLPDSGERYLSGALFDGLCPGIEEAKAGDVI